MKFFLALCLVVYFLAEVSAKPAPQWLDQAREMIEKAKEKAQEAVNQAQEAMSNAFEVAKNAVQNGFNTAQQTAQEKFGLGENITQMNIPSLSNSNPPAS